MKKNVSSLEANKLEIQKNFCTILDSIGDVQIRNDEQSKQPVQHAMDAVAVETGGAMCVWQPFGSQPWSSVLVIQQQRYYR